MVCTGLPGGRLVLRTYVSRVQSSDDSTKLDLVRKLQEVIPNLSGCCIQHPKATDMRILPPEGDEDTGMICTKIW